MNDPRQVTVLGDLEVEAFPVNDERALRDEVALAEEVAGWSELDDPARAAMTDLVRGCLLRLAEDVDAWLPAAVVARKGTKFGFFVFWKNGHLEEEVVRTMARAAHDQKNRLADLKRLAGRARNVDGSAS